MLVLQTCSGVHMLQTLAALPPLPSPLSAVPVRPADWTVSRAPP